MENAKDTFYIALRNRLSALNPTRTILLRGVWRPGVLVEANESVAAHLPADAFVLRWTNTSVDEQHSMPVAQQMCEIAYTTEGTSGMGGLDRGRVLAEMDRELLAALQPSNTRKFDYTRTPAAAMGTSIFWPQPTLEGVQTVRDRLSRTVKVTVFSYEEAGE